MADRFQIFDYPPNWADPVSVKYRFATALHASEHYLEQRKPMRERPERGLVFSVLADKQAPEIWNYLQRSLNSSLYVPIWTEPIIPSALSWPAISCNDISSYYNLQELTRYLVILDPKQAADPELLDLAAIDSATELLTTQETGYSFGVSNPLIYPALPAILASIQKIDETTEVATLELTFTEYVDGGGP